MAMNPITTPIDPKWEWHHKALLRLRDTLLHEREEREAAVRNPVELGGEDVVDRANEKCEHDALLAAMRIEEAELSEVEAALERLRKGTYGICEITGRPIAAARLRALPWTRLSHAAAEKQASETRRAAAG